MKTPITPSTRERPIPSLNRSSANRDDPICDLQRVVAECEQDFIALRDFLPNEAREKALGALASSREHEFAAIAKRFHWRARDLRRELEIELRCNFGRDAALGHARKVESWNPGRSRGQPVGNNSLNAPFST